MIDTDKYEWDTNMRLVVVNGKLYLEGNTLYPLNLDNQAVAQVITDAPIILEAYKRLREQYTELREALVGDSPNWTHEELIEKVLEIYDKEYDEK